MIMTKLNMALKKAVDELKEKVSEIINLNDRLVKIVV